MTPNPTPAAITADQLAALQSGDPIAEYGPFVNLTFVERSNGHVTMRDKHGTEKRVYESLFLRHAKLSPKPRFENVSCSQCGMDFGPGDHGYSHCSDHLQPPPPTPPAEIMERIRANEALAKEGK